MEILLTNENIGSGTLSSKNIGEWPGIKSCKWTTSKKIINRPNTSRYNDGTGFGRQHYNMKNAEEKLFSPGKKNFECNNARTKYLEERKLSLRKIVPVIKENKTFFSKRHYKNVPSSESEQKYYLKTFYPKGHCKTYDEIPLDKEVGQKNKINTIDKMRNGLPLIAPGDKSYKNPEYSNNFFQEGGLIPGSTNILNYKQSNSKKSYFFYETLDLGIKTLNPKKLWSNKEKQDLIDFDENYVKKLDDWEKILGVEVPKVENKNIIVKKK